MTNWQEVWNTFLQLGIAYLLTAIIGWNREREEHNAGIRAFPIVGMASCGYLLILGPHTDAAAQSRVLQGMITGIGFVGGGAILKDGASIRGIATAASIWNAGVIGASVALGRYNVAVILCLMNFLTLRLLYPLKMWLDRGKEERAAK